MKKLSATLLLAGIVAVVAIGVPSVSTVASQGSAHGSAVAVGWWPHSIVLD